MYFIDHLLNLQLFADGGAVGGDGGSGTADGMGVTSSPGSQKGVKADPYANVVFGKQGEASPPPQENEGADPDKEFEEAIKGKYKDQYGKRVQDAVQKRLKSSKEITDRYKALSPALDLLAKKYGCDATDVAALSKAIEADDALIEDEAIKKGYSVDQYREVLRMERENHEFHEMMREKDQQERADKQYSVWMEQAESAKQMFPELDLNTEAQNPKFCELLQAGIDVATAYKVIHMDDITTAMMQYSTKTAEQKIVNRVIANGVRPSENGMSTHSTAIIKSDVSKLSRKDRQEIARRVARGEKISF